MIDHYKILTLTFSDARLDELGDYLISSDHMVSENERLRSLRLELGVEELYYLNTCNRVLFLFYTTQPVSQVHEKLSRFLQHQSPRGKSCFELNQYTGEDAIRHFFEVAASLKSMVVGEQEILRQVKEAYERSWNNGTSGDQIRILFQSALHAAKAVHHETRISEKSVSVVSLAMKKLRRLGIHPDDEIILIGAGDTMQNVARFLKEWKMSNVKVFNRSEVNLYLIKEILPEAETYLLDELAHHNLNVPFIVSCTGSVDYVLTPELIEQSTEGQGLTDNRGILDLAVPRDVHPAIITEYGLKVIEVESLRSLADKNRSFRMKEVAVANELINDEVLSFREKVHRRFIEKAFMEIPDKIYAVRDRAINEVYKSQIENLDPEGQELVKEIMDYMARKCISIPMQTARKQYLVIRNDLYQHERNPHVVKEV